MLDNLLERHAEGAMELQDQVAIVTGAVRGIGKAIALRFAQEGADIAVVDIDPGTAAATAHEIREFGRRALVRTADVSDPEDVATAVTEIVEELGRIDILVNNAGIETRVPPSASRTRRTVRSRRPADLAGRGRPGARLLCDGAGPFFNAHRADELGPALHAALDSLEAHVMERTTGQR